MRSDYAFDPYFLGTTVGRYANRIRDACFELHGRSYKLDANEKRTGHCLHGGEHGLFAQRFAMAASDDGRTVECRYESPDGEQGFPGCVDVLVSYSLLTDFSLGIDFVARAHADTVLSLANHAYFNLDRQSRSIDAHVLKLHADFYTPADSTGIPTGEIRSVAASKFDLRDGSALANQFDHNFVLRDAGGELRDAAELYSADSGIRLRLQTTQPGLQLYTGDSLRAPFTARQGVCLEAQNYPNAPNQPGFPSASLAAGETYRQRTIYEFQSLQCS
jgi:aldose 1-epimerase